MFFFLFVCFVLLVSGLFLFGFGLFYSCVHVLVNVVLLKGLKGISFFGGMLCMFFFFFFFFPFGDGF